MEPPLDASNPEQREKLRRLFRVKKTEGEMMAQRGFRLDYVFMMRPDRTFAPIDLSGLQNPTLRPEQLLAWRQQAGFFMSRQEFSSIYVATDNPNRQVLVIYLGNEPGKQVAKKHFEIVYDFVRTQLYHHIILITETGLNAENSNYVQNRVSNYKIEVFLDMELSFNRPGHALAPISVRHVPAKQVPQWAQEERIQAEKLPMILNMDPLSKWYSAEPLDVLQTEIMGSSTDTAGFYRICRMAPTVKK